MVPYLHAIGHINDTLDTYENKENKEEIITHLRDDNLKHSIFNY